MAEDNGNDIQRLAPTPYELAQIDAVRAWKAKKPSVVGRTLDKVTKPLVWLAQRAIPAAAVQGALDGSNWLAQRATFERGLLRRAGVTSIEELREGNLERADGLAQRVQGWAIGIAIAEGAGSGSAGLPGLAIGIPAIVTLALRTCHQIGLCYGYRCVSDVDKQFIFSILAVAGANSVEEKTAALLTLKMMQVTLARTTWKAMVEKAAQQRISKEAILITVRSLGKQLGINISKRRALAAIPVIGAVVGASADGWFIKEVSGSARRAFQERWLIDNRKLTPPVDEGAGTAIG